MLWIKLRKGKRLCSQLSLKGMNDNGYGQCLYWHIFNNSKCHLISPSVMTTLCSRCVQKLDDLLFSELLCCCLFCFLFLSVFMPTHIFLFFLNFSVNFIKVFHNFSSAFPVWAFSFGFLFKFSFLSSLHPVIFAFSILIFYSLLWIMTQLSFR